MRKAATAYDEVFYAGHPYDYTHPDRLASLATLHGMNPAPVSHCRVLELGCGVGDNLIPMAFQLPDSTFVGVDLSRRSIDKGLKTIVALELTNIQLLHFDIMDITSDFGEFDYIIAHGVYSWVPHFVRKKMLWVFKNNLAPHGVAYVSYNAHPGSHLRDLARSMMLYHVRSIDAPEEKVRQARALMEFLAAATPGNNLYGCIVRSQHDRIGKMADEYLFHDDLKEIGTAFLLHEVVEAAGRQGLQYLCDTTFSRSELRNHSKRVQEELRNIPESDLVARDQYLDFIAGDSFRNTLLCHKHVELRRSIDPRSIRDYHLASSLRPTSLEPEGLRDGPMEFKSESGQMLATDHHLTKAALVILGESWPQAVAFPEVLQKALSRLGADGDKIKNNIDEEMAAAENAFFRMFSAGHIELHLYPPRLITNISERPRASLLARKQAETGSLLTSLRHGGVLIDDEMTRKFLALLDGTRTVDEIASDLNAVLTAAELGAAGEQGRQGQPAPRVGRENVEQNLKRLAVLGLLDA
jgi:methyltransferase-like protein/protein-L-isoaspartate O-methyltransferase